MSRPQEGGKEVQLAVLAATCSTAIVFFPVVLLTGVSKYLFTALALAVVIALFCSYFVAMTVVPLFCSRFIKHTGHGNEHEQPIPPPSACVEGMRKRTSLRRLCTTSTRDLRGCRRVMTAQSTSA